MIVKILTSQFLKLCFDEFMRVYTFQETGNKHFKNYVSLDVTYESSVCTLCGLQCNAMEAFTQLSSICTHVWNERRTEKGGGSLG